jgi:hypothetical protein
MCAELLDFRSASFSVQSRINADMTKAKFHRSTIHVADLTGCQWPYKEIVYEEKLTRNKETPDYEKISFDDLKAIYQNLKVSYQRSGDYEQGGKFFFREKEMKRKGSTLVESMWLTFFISFMWIW